MEITYIVIFGILGAVIGSFLNVVIDRLPAGKSIAYPPSSCDACQHRLSWPDLFPVFSYLFLHGRRRYCKAKIPQRVFWVELGTGLLTAGLFWRFRWKPILPVMLVYCSALIAIALIDLKEQLIFPAIVFLVALVALVVNFFIPKLYNWHNFLFGFLGAAFGSIFLLLAFVLSKLILKREGMGLGDVYMAVMMGFMVGFPNIIVALFIGIILGGLTAIFLVSSKKKSTKDVIPFGDFLAIGTIITLVWGTQILHWYLHLAHFE